MSKSLGNFFTVRDLLDQGIPGEVIRFVFLSTHYRKPMDWTAEKAQVARNHLRRWWSLVGPIETQDSDDRVPQELLDCLANDLDTHSAIQLLHRYAKEMRIDELRAGAHVLGFLDNKSSYDELVENDWLAEETAQLIETSIFEWHELRQRRDFKQADEVRDKLLQLGIRPISKKDEASTWVFANPDRSADTDNKRLLDGLNSILEALK